MDRRLRAAGRGGHGLAGRDQPDVTAGGLLHVTARMYRIDQASGGMEPDPDPVNSRAGLTGWCTISVSGDKSLDRSLIGLGTAPLPVA